jgi:hypothetical protein
LPFGTPDKTVDRATVDPRRRLPEILFAMAWKPCSFCRGIGINFAVEFVFFLPWNPCSLWRGIFTLASCFLRQHPHGSHCSEVFVLSGSKRPDGPAPELLTPEAWPKKYFPIEVTRSSRPPN